MLAVAILRWPEQLNLWPGLLPLLLAVSVLAALACFHRQLRHVWFIGAALALGAAAALGSVARTTHVVSALAIDAYANRSYVTIEGRIAAEPDRRPMQTKYTVAVAEIRGEQGADALPVTGLILATDRRQWPEFRYGDTVTVRGVLERPGQIEDFHYDRYLSRYGIYAVMYSASLQAVGTGEESLSIRERFFGTLFGVKERFEAQIARLYPEPHASFMAGLLTGSRRGIPDALLQNFNRTGLTHLIAISGYNITIVVAVITALLFWLPLKWRFLPAVAAIVCFTLFVGASAAVTRAAIMGILGLLALQLGRQSHVRLAVLWTAVAMLAWNPKLLWYDAGFQLSFLAVLGLTELGPLLEQWFRRVPSVLGVREALQMTCAAQLTAVPLTILLFGRFSLIAPVANVLVAPFVPLAMLFGFLGTAVSFLAFFPGQLLSFVGWGCLEWIVLVTKGLAAVPLASVDTPRMHAAAVGAYYAGLILWIIRRQRKANT